MKFVISVLIAACYAITVYAVSAKGINGNGEAPCSQLDLYTSIQSNFLDVA